MKKSFSYFVRIHRGRWFAWRWWWSNRWFRLKNIRLGRSMKHGNTYWNIDISSQRWWSFWFHFLIKNECIFRWETFLMNLPVLSAVVVAWPRRKKQWSDSPTTLEFPYRWFLRDLAFWFLFHMRIFGIFHHYRWWIFLFVFFFFSLNNNKIPAFILSKFHKISHSMHRHH